jgi:hypothetical protein
MVEDEIMAEFFFFPGIVDKFASVIFLLRCASPINDYELRK